MLKLIDLKNYLDPNLNQHAFNANSYVELQIDEPLTKAILSNWLNLAIIK